DAPFALKQLVWMHIDSPSKGSPRQLCVSFFEEMDRLVGTNLFAKHGTGRRVLDEMIVQMAAAANRHALGLLVIDEIQHLTEAKGTDSEELLNFLVTLVNKISVPVMIIGTPKSLPLLQGAFRQARRASGLGSLFWDRMKPGRTWDDFVDRMWARQWTREPSPLTDDVRVALYDESQGVVDVVVKLYMLAQIRVIQHAALVPRSSEIIDAEALRRTSRDHLALVQPMLDALRRDDAKALASFDDLTGLQDHVDDVVRDILVDVTPRVRAPRPVDEKGTDLLLMLERLGVPLDAAVTLLEAARAEAPEASDFDLIGAIHAKLHQPPPALARSRPRKSQKAAAPTDPLLLPEHDSDGYAAFAAAGLLRLPSDDVSAGAPEAV
ncbi:MAG: ATP-binding protein, partial [Halieaceae bacterium]|nr:ATP-binding protein [Halieaceae bacterium]